MWPVEDESLVVSRNHFRYPGRVMELPELGQALVRLGCPPEKAAEMAGQLDKRARQLAEAKGKTYEEAMAHLLAMMKQGWSAKERGF